MPMCRSGGRRFTDFCAPNRCNLRAVSTTPQRCSGPRHMTLDTELAALHKPLLRFAQMQLRNDSLTEDVVSETLLAIIEKPANFEGRSTLRTYATGILKFKIIDVLRARGREVHIEPLDDQSMDDAIDALFAGDGHWREPPAAWQQPEKAEALQICVDRLPAKMGRVTAVGRSRG